MPYYTYRRIEMKSRKRNQTQKIYNYFGNIAMCLVMATILNECARTWTHWHINQQVHYGRPINTATPGINPTPNQQNCNKRAHSNTDTYSTNTNIRS